MLTCLKIFLSEYRFDVSKLEPVVAKPHSPDNRALARECKDVKINRVYIGSCTGGKTEDFMAAAKVFLASGKKVKVPTFLVPATQKVWMDIYSIPVPGSGGKTCSQIFEEAGCDTPASPSCGACLGGPKDTYARMNEPQARSLLLPHHLAIDKCSSTSLCYIYPYYIDGIENFGTDLSWH
ncbi:2-methylmalate dehydratase [Vigna unguiculata]|uniref:2-methylmalate dehydratase n=1 Tax=Vigna unguiculata TaxID=3917 RepID=A0A4D6MXJ8_VIGUN|nr:2-methylmalate dehydratase [Vigna unguiculata]